MNAALLRELLDKYMTDTATEQERLQLYGLLQEAPYLEELAAIITGDLETQHYNNEEDPAVKALLHQRITHAIRHEQPAPVRAIAKRRRKHSWLYAAAVFLLLAAGFWWLRPPTPGTQQQAQQPAIDLAPGHEGAVLTLANGTQVVLDSLAAGTIAQQENSTITKTDGATLAYTSHHQAFAAVSYNTLTTPAGRQFSVVLPDGSKVWLNAASSLRYPTAFTDKDRTVTLTGEAYFEIAANAQAPFRVLANEKAAVEVLGTSFNINAYTDESAINTTLLEGSVRVKELSTIPLSANTPLSAIMLTPGQQARLQQHLTVHPADVQQVVAWKNGLFSFYKADLRAIMRQIARWYNVEVQYEGSTGVELFSGKIGRNLSLREVMEGLAFTHVKYRIEEGRRIVVLP